MPMKNGGVQTEGGWYDKDEFEQHADVASKGIEHIKNTMGVDDADAKDHQRRFASPLQGMLFDPSESYEDRDHAVQHHYVSTYAHGDKTHDYDPSTEESVQNQIRWSAMPTELVKSLGGLTSVQRGGPGDLLGWYQSHVPGGPITARVDSAHDLPSPNTTLHELGHRADFRSYNAEGTDKDRAAPTVPPLVHPNPRLEGIADGFVDRYGKRNKDDEWSHLNSGYGLGFPGRADSPLRHQTHWHDQDRAVYGAARAHFDKTGENPTIPGMEGVTVKQNDDEYLHMMQRTSPHARQALMAHNQLTNTHGPLWNAASQASSRYLSTRKVGTQLSMLDEVQATTDSAPNDSSPTYHTHTVGYAVRHSLLSPDGQVAEQQRKEKMVSSFQPPEGHAPDGWSGAESMDRHLYDDPYANGVSHEQHAKTVASELASVKAKQDKARQSRRAARGRV
jgi:hypothetical protein